MAGAPKGNSNASKGKEATKALYQALSIASGMKEEKDVLSKYRALVDIWLKQIDLAKEGNPGSATMIVDRLEGKPKQAVVGGDDGDPPIKVTQIELIALDESSS